MPASRAVLVCALLPLGESVGIPALSAAVGDLTTAANSGTEAAGQRFAHQRDYGLFYAAMNVGLLSEPTRCCEKGQKFQSPLEFRQVLRQCER